jgi:5'(3')-deoxyribonucleotidase
MLGREIQMDHLKDWSLSNILPADMLTAFWLKIGEPGLCRNLLPYPGAVEGMKKLAEVAEIFIVTSHLHDSPQWVHERDQWFAEHFDIPREKIVYAHEKHVFYGKMLIDDKPQNIDDWAREHETGVPVLWLQPYNLMHVSPSNHRYRVVHTNSWDKVVDIVTSL